VEEKMNNSQRPIARKSGLVVQEVPDELLVYDLDSNKAHCLNQSAAMVWKSCDGSNSVAEIADLVGKQAGNGVTEDFVWLAIDQLNENNLLEKEVPVDMKGLSRREAIKKIGLASMIAVPIIASLVAPQSAMAAGSCLCTQQAQCPALPSCGSASCNCAGVCAPGGVLGTPECTIPRGGAKKDSGRSY
jgi:hypothetical protein